MKKLATFFGACIALAFLGSCSTVDFAALHAMKKVTVVSIACNKRLNMPSSSQSQGGGLLVALATTAVKAANEKDYDLSAATPAIRDSIFATYARALPFKVGEDPSLLASDQYKIINGDPNASNPNISTPEGYLSINPQDSDKAKKLFSLLPDTDGIMYVAISYLLQKDTELGGIGHAKVAATIRVIIVDRGGKTVFDRAQTSPSDSLMAFAVDGAVMESAKLVPLSIEATNKAGTDLAIWIQEQSAD